MTLIKEYVGHYDSGIDGMNISELRTKLKKIREDIRKLQNENDQDKLDALSSDITQLYKTSVSVSELSEYDFQKEGFRIRYIKNGRMMIPSIWIWDYSKHISMMKKR